MRVLLFLAVAVVLVVGDLPCFSEQTAHAADVDALRDAIPNTPENSIVAKDVYYKTEGLVSGPPAPILNANDYPSLNLPAPFNDTRLIIWFFAQQHLYFGSFVLGVLFLVMIFELRCLMAGTKETAQRYDGLA